MPGSSYGNAIDGMWRCCLIFIEDQTYQQHSRQTPNMVIIKVILECIRIPASGSSDHFEAWQQGSRDDLANCARLLKALTWIQMRQLRFAAWPITPILTYRARVIRYLRIQRGAAALGILPMNVLKNRRWLLPFVQ